MLGRVVAPLDRIAPAPAEAQHPELPVELPAPHPEALSHDLVSRGRNELEGVVYIGDCGDLDAALADVLQAVVPGDEMVNAHYPALPARM